MATSTEKLTLMIDKRVKKVIFAEAEKDFVDIILYDPFLLLPEAGPRPKHRTLYKCNRDRHVTDSRICQLSQLFNNYELPIMHNIKDICALEKRVEEFGTDHITNYA
ncbi:hypothetical protein ACOSQ2_033001 [Xanthoceras sorbifolium]